MEYGDVLAVRKMQTAQVMKNAVKQDWDQLPGETEKSAPPHLMSDQDIGELSVIWLVKL